MSHPRPRRTGLFALFLHSWRSTPWGGRAHAFRHVGHLLLAHVGDSAHHEDVASAVLSLLFINLGSAHAARGKSVRLLVAGRAKVLLAGLAFLDGPSFQLVQGGRLLLGGDR